MRLDRHTKPEQNKEHEGPSLWSLFFDSVTRDEYLRNWLALQCSLLSGVVQGVLTMGDEKGESFAPVSKWPEKGQDAERLADVSERAIVERCGLLVELETQKAPGNDESTRYGVAYPVFIEERLLGVVAVEVSVVSRGLLRPVMEQLQWGVSWLELFFLRLREKKEGLLLSRLKSAVDLLTDVLAEERFEGSAMAFVTDLATRLECDRVSLGFVSGNHVRVKAVSHSAEFGKRMNLIRAISRVMEEAVFQRREILYPVPADSEVLVVREHEELARQHGGDHVLTVPFFVNDRYHGAVTLERQSAEPFSEDDIEFCRSVSALIFPVLESKQSEDRLILFKITDSIKRQGRRLFGPRYAGRKLVSVLLMILVAFFAFKNGDYRLSADTTLEAAVLRVVSAPFKGYVKEAPIRAGDVVKKDTVICALDDRDLRLERLNWLSKKTQFKRQYQQAVAEHNRAEANIINARLDQAEARLALVESRLERTIIRAPFRGIVISGDLSQNLGGSVEQGEVLFEIAPLDAYRVILKVDERRIGDVSEGQKGSLVLSSLPGSHFDFVVEKMTPISIAEEGHNYFRVEARLERVSERLRPGMEGIGKIFIDRRRLISIWTRDLREWLRLRLWSWF